eukprot:TRINITY_DN11735_c1_g9_i1.p1 TRINITY_DN11735_c1_g9~~TRINITY_DN11735_c1_g9_i1.p1  ORF type:complete len:438 (+),score=79.87 TRINITY_DN11735_c1_g9_i1:69-1316(+)
MHNYAALATAIAVVSLRSAIATPMTLSLLSDEVQDGVMCLDGSPAGFYYAPATSSDYADKWQIYFQGGGWCYEEYDCLERSKGRLGSSKTWTPTQSPGGFMSDDCTVNPEFCNFNRVFMPYCDGASFSGNRRDPVNVNGTDIYFRGHLIVEAIINALYKRGLKEATQVVLTGCSAGGLATYLHADYVHDMLKANVSGLTKYKAAPISGFFLRHETVEGKPVYPDEMKYIFNLANASSGVDQDCIEAHSPDQQWRCIFAPDTYPYITSPIFPFNSALDSWQTRCIYTSEYVPHNSTANGACGVASGYDKCASDPETCDGSQILRMIEYERDFMSNMTNAPTFKRQGNGAFIYSCHTHCAAQSSAYNTFKVNGVSMQEAVLKWWQSEDDAAENHTYTPCEYNHSEPYRCNPTCSPNE